MTDTKPTAEERARQRAWEALRWYWGNTDAPVQLADRLTRDFLAAEAKGRREAFEEVVRAVKEIRVKLAAKLRVSAWDVADDCLNAVRALAKGDK